MASGPEEWFSLATLEKYGFPGGIIAGWLSLSMAIKRGWFFIGDRTKLASLLAAAERDVIHQKALMDIKDAEIATLKAENAGLLARAPRE